MKAKLLRTVRKHRKYIKAILLDISLALFVVVIAVLTFYVLKNKYPKGAAFEFVGFVLAAVALLYAMIQFVHARGHSRKMEDIAHSMSTRYIGLFPKDLEDIVQVVRSAGRQLLILADSMGYGQYSNPDTYRKFIEETKNARERGVEVRFLVYDEELAVRALNQQFNPGKFDETRSSPEYDHYFEIFPGIHRPETQAAFLKILRGKQCEVATQLGEKGVDIRPLPKEERLFFWLEDDEDAVFSFENIGEGRPLCFRTRDAKLIETFKCIFDRSWKSLEPKIEVLAKTG